MSDETPPEPEPQSPRKRFNWLRRESIDLGDAAVQFIAVVVGIVLGLFINQWVGHRQQQAAVLEAMHSIRAELVGNRQTIHASVDHLYGMATRMATSPVNQNKPDRTCFKWDGFGGTGTVALTDAAYQTAIATQALAHMPFEQAERVAQAYSRQHATEKSFQLIRSDLLLSGAHSLKVCVSAVESFANNERRLDKAYTALIGPDKAIWPRLPPEVQDHPSPPK